MRSHAGGRMVRWSTTGVVVALLLTTGCSGEEEPDATAPASPSSSETGPPAAAPSAAASSDDDGRQDVGAPEAVGDVPAEPVAAVPGAEAGTVLEVYRLARSGETATLTMAALNEGPEQVSLGTSFSAGAADLDAGGISLLDPVGLQRYLVLRDSERACLCSSFRDGSAVNIDPGKRLFFSASFPAPPPEVTSVTVETPSGSLVDVPVTEA